MRNSRGFSFLDLMIVIAIMGILAAIFIPAYQDMEKRKTRIEFISSAAPTGTVFVNVGLSFNANLLEGSVPDADTYCFVSEGAELTLLQVARTSSGVVGAYFSGACRNRGNIFIARTDFAKLEPLVPPQPSESIPPLEQ